MSKTDAEKVCDYADALIAVAENSDIVGVSNVIKRLVIDISNIVFKYMEEAE